MSILFSLFGPRKSRQTYKHWFVLMGLVSTLFLAREAMANTLSIDITAEFKPSALDTNLKHFKNTTAPSRICIDHPWYCPGPDVYTGLTNFTYKRTYRGPSTDDYKAAPNTLAKWRLGKYQALVKAPKTVKVTNTLTGQSSLLLIKLLPKIAYRIDVDGDIGGGLASKFNINGCYAGQVA
ncbi:MAG: hypothetical protein ACRC0J_19165, partial [Shewanella oncorhynchi]